MRRRSGLLARRIWRRIAAVATLLELLMQPLDSRAGDAWSASLGTTTNYVYRGISQTSDGPALQIGLNYENSAGWFMGTWGSNVDPYPGRAQSTELNVYTGLGRDIGGDFMWRGVYTHYSYLGDPRSADYSHNEIAISISYLDLLAASVSYQPDSSSYTDLGFALKRTTLAYELTGRWPLRLGLAVTGDVGYYDLHDSFGVGYWAGSAGISYAVRRVAFSLVRFSCDRTAARLYDEASADGRWALSAVLHF